jgi:hypothetical protein
LIERESFFRSPKLEGALKGEAEQWFRGRAFGWKRVPEFQDPIVFSTVECVRGFTFES